MALLLAGLRGVDDEIWKAARIDGIPRWRVYEMVRNGEAPPFKKIGKTLRFPIAGVRTWLAHTSQ